MLRITRIPGERATLFRLEGKIIGLWVDELAAAIAAEPYLPSVELDLTGIAFVDAAGTVLLQTLIRSGARVVRRSDFVATLLEVE